MRLLMRRCLAGVAVAVIAPMISACAAPPKACSLIGAESAVTLRLPKSVLVVPHPVTMTACINGHCRRQTYNQGPDPRFPTIAVQIPVPAYATVRVRVAVRMGPWRGHGVTIAHSRSYSPNGPGCPPTVWGVGLIATRTGRILPTH